MIEFNFAKPREPGGWATTYSEPKSAFYWLNQMKRETREHVAAVAVILAITVIFFWPLLRGRSFSMVGAHMFAQYPWGSVIQGDPREVRGVSFAQTDHADGLYPLSVFATNALRSGQLPMWLTYSFNGSPIMEAVVGGGIDLSPANAGRDNSVAYSSTRSAALQPFAARRSGNVCPAALLGRKCFGSAIWRCCVAVQWPHRLLSGV